MPGTAKGLEQRYGINTSTPYGNLLGGAYYLAEQKKRFKTWRLALAAYNAGPGAVQEYGGVPPYEETQRYVRNILAKAGVLNGTGKAGAAGTPLPAGAAPPTPPQIVPGTPPVMGEDPYTPRDVLFESAQALASGRYDPQEALRGLLKASEVEPEVLSPGVPAQVIPGKPGAQGALPPVKGGEVDVSKWVRVPPRRGQWPAPGPEILRFTAQLARTSGRQLDVWDTSTHSKYTTSGRVSAHTTGDAVDIPAKGARLLRLGRLALIQAGMPRKQAMKQKGGLYNIGGMQIIFNTQEGGDHTDHLHLGRKRG